jgi:hypothetical protein
VFDAYVSHNSTTVRALTRKIMNELIKNVAPY